VVTERRERGVVAGAVGGATIRARGEGKTEFVSHPSQIGFSFDGAKRGKNNVNSKKELKSLSLCVPWVPRQSYLSDGGRTRGSAASWREERGCLTPQKTGAP
jgi:hypothetical protein